MEKWKILFLCEQNSVSGFLKCRSCLIVVIISPSSGFLKCNLICTRDNNTLMSKFWLIWISKWIPKSDFNNFMEINNQVSKSSKLNQSQISNIFWKLICSKPSVLAQQSNIMTSSFYECQKVFSNNKPTLSLYSS